jgi:hypothetical protein
MPGDTVEMQVVNAGGKVRLLSLHDIDRRTAAYRRTVDLIEAMESDLGGADQLSTGARQIVQRIGLMCALSESLEAAWLSGKEIDAVVYCTIANAQKRLLEIVGLRRLPKVITPTLEQYAAIVREREAKADS